MLKFIRSWKVKMLSPLGRAVYDRLQNPVEWKYEYASGGYMLTNIDVPSLGFRLNGSLAGPCPKIQHLKEWEKKHLMREAYKCANTRAALDVSLPRTMKET